jgi:uncharacterized protein YqeY
VVNPVSLKERIHAEITAAMRSGESLRRDVLRMAQNAVDLAEKRDRRPATDDEVVAILAHQVKTRRESVEAFTKGGRPDLADKELAEIAILAEFLPSALSADEVAALVAQALAETGATTPRDLGKVMGWLAPRTRGRVDGRELSGKVAQALAAANLAAHDGGGTPGGAPGGPTGSTPGRAPDTAPSPAPEQRKP